MGSAGPRSMANRLSAGAAGSLLPWLVKAVGDPSNPLEPNDPTVPEEVWSIAAFFGGYSVRFATGLIERLMAAVFPDNKSE